MTEFEYQPINKVIIRQIIKETYNDFVDSIVFANNIPPRYCNGILFVFWPAQRSETIAQKEYEGIYVWELMEFAKCEKKPDTMKRKDGIVEMVVIDVSKKPLFVDMVNWLKTQQIWND